MRETKEQLVSRMRQLESENRSLRTTLEEAKSSLFRVQSESKAYAENYSILSRRTDAVRHTVRAVLVTLYGVGLTESTDASGKFTVKPDVVTEEVRALRLIHDLACGRQSL